MLQRRVAVVLKVAAILIPLILVYWQDLQIVASDALTSEVMNYIIVIPFFIAYALYRKRRMLQAVTPLENHKEIERTERIAGLSLCLSAFILYWHGSYTFYPVEYHLLSMPLFLAGAILLVFNWQTLRQLIFPLVLLLFLEPLPLQAANMIGFQMSALSSVAAYNLVKLFGLPVTLTTLQTPIIIIQTVQGIQLPLAIDVACSGLYSLTGFVAFAVFAAFIMRGPAWKRAALFIVGFPMMYGLNILRLSTIVWIAHGWGGGAAMQAFHLLGGPVLIFIATLLLLTVGDRVAKLRIFTTTVSQEPCPLCAETKKGGESFCPHCGTFQEPQEQGITTRNTAKIAAVIGVTFLIILIQIPPFAVAKGTAGIDLETFSASELKHEILPTITGWDLNFVYRDTRIEQVTNWDAALVYSYQKQESDNPRPTVYVLIQIATGRHTWEASLYEYPAKHGQPTAAILEQVDINVLDDPKVTGRYLEFTRVGSTVPEALVYWFEKALFTANDTQVSRYVCISLDTFPEDLAKAGMIDGENDIEGIQAILLPMARSIAEHWEPMKTFAWVNVGLGQWGPYIVILAVAPCIIVVGLLYVKMRTERKRIAEVYQQLELPQEKKVLEALAQASKENLPTGKAIQAKYSEATGKTLEPKALIETLNEAAKTRLVEKVIASREDEPVLVWKHRFQTD